jgi:hypothetical protein
MVAWLELGCSGVLVAPDVLVYAAHCGVSASVASFGDVLDVQLDPVTKTATVLARPGTISVALSSCESYPGWSYGAGNDLAFCILAQPVIAATSIPPPLRGCQASSLAVDTECTLVGYGRSSSADAVGTKRTVRVPLAATDPELTVGDDLRGTCAGDSGGPAFIALGALPDQPDWHLAGVLSSGIAGEGCGVSYYTKLSPFVSWIESSSGRSLTPCLDTDGIRSASGSCSGAALDADGEPSAAAVVTSSGCPAAMAASAASCAVSVAPRRGSALAVWATLAALALCLERRRRARARR